MTCLSLVPLQQKQQKIHRLWLEYKGVVFPDCAYSDSVAIADESIIADFANNYSEYDFMVRGMDFDVFKNHVVKQHCYLLSLKGNSLHHPAIAGKFRVDPMMVLESDAFAYTESGDTSYSVSIVEKINGRNQIQINSESEVEVSPDLLNKQVRMIRCPIIFDRCVVSNGNPITELFDVNFIAIAPDTGETFFYNAQGRLQRFWANKWVQELEKPVRRFKFEINPEEIHCSKL